MPGQHFQLSRGFFRSGVAHQLDLVEFVRAQYSASVLARGAGLAPKTLAVGDEAARQRVAIQDLVTIEIRDRYFGGRDEKEIVAGRGVRVLLELRQLTRSRHRRSGDEEG